jgi:hypothetical protein
VIRTMPPIKAGGPVTATTAHQPQIDRLSSGAIRPLDSQSSQSAQVHCLLPIEVTVEADVPHPGWTVRSLKAEAAEARQTLVRPCACEEPRRPGLRVVGGRDG